MRVIVFLIEIILVAAAAIWLVGQDGQLIFEWGGYQIKAQLAVAFLGFVVVFLAIYFVLRIWRLIVLFPSRMFDRAQRQRPEKGVKALTQAAISTALDEYDQARNESRRFERFLGDNPVHYALIAYNYVKEGKYDEALAACESMKRDDDGKTLAWAMQARIAILRGQDLIAVEHLTKLFKIHNSSPWVIKNLIKYAIRVKKFETSQNALKRAEKLKIYTSQVIHQVNALISYENSQSSSLSLDEKESLLERAHRLSSDIPQIAVQYAKVLRMRDKERRARKVLEHAWSRRPTPEIMEEYLVLESSTDPKAILADIDRLMTFNPSDLQSFLAMAGLSLKHQHWGRARAALHDAQEEHGLNQEVCHMMAQLELMEHGDQAAYRDWMERALTSPIVTPAELNFESVLK